MDRQTKSCFYNNRLLLFYHQIVTKPPEFERFPEMGESSLTESDSDYMEPVMYTNTERKDVFVIEVNNLINLDIICIFNRTWRVVFWHHTDLRSLGTNLKISSPTNFRDCRSSGEVWVLEDWKITCLDQSSSNWSHRLVKNLILLEYLKLLEYTVPNKLKSFYSVFK